MKSKYSKVLSTLTLTSVLLVMAACKSSDSGGTGSSAQKIDWGGDTCCAKAEAAGKTCTHECCVKAAKNGTFCPGCNPNAKIVRK